MQTDDYRQLIKAELLSRIKKNSRYSLRAFARDLSISNAFLSQLLNGKRSLSEMNGLKLARAFKWDTEKTELLLKLIRLDQCKDPALKAHLYQDLQGSYDFFDLEAEKFETISNWIHFAILELTRIDGFKSDPKWIGKRLGVTRQEAEDAIRRLVSIGLLEERGGTLALVKNSSIPDAPSAAVRRFHKMHLEKAALAIEEQAVDKRLFSGITMAIDPKQIPVANEMIRKFRRKLMKALEEGEKTAVYQMSIQLFQLDKEIGH